VPATPQTVRAMPAAAYPARPPPRPGSAAGHPAEDHN